MTPKSMAALGRWHCNFLNWCADKEVNWRTTGVSQDELFDRHAAQMMLGMTAALVSSGLRAR